jgi:hypothetical protein
MNPYDYGLNANLKRLSPKTKMMEGPMFLGPMRGGFRNHNKLPTQYLDQVPLQQSNMSISFVAKYQTDEKISSTPCH